METNREVIKAKTNTTAGEESAIVERVARIVSSVRGNKPDYRRLAAELEQALPFDVFGVVLLRHDREAVRVVVCTRLGEDWHASYHQHPYAGSMLEQLVQEPSLRARDYATALDGSPAESGDALSGHHQLRAAIITPLLIEDRVLGTLELGSMVPGTYQDETLQRLIKAVGHVLASAIESAQSSGSAEIQDRQRQALKDVSSALTSEVELSAVLNQIVGGIAEALHVTSLVVMAHWRENRLSLEAQSGLDNPRMRAVFEGCWPPSTRCIIGDSLLLQQVCISQDISTDERYPESRKFFEEGQLRSICTYPLVTGSAVYGALLICSPEPGGFTPLKVDILSLFASQATVAIHNCTLLEAAQQRNRFQEAIARLEQAHLRTGSGALSLSDTRIHQVSEQDVLQEEYALLKSVREETQRTFGVSFRSLLRFISDHLLTQHERDLHALLHADQPHLADRDGLALRQILTPAGQEIEAAQQSAELRSVGKEAFTHTVTLLSQTAEAALLGTDMLGELSRLLLQLQHTTANGVKDAWFVVDEQGKCVYMNPLAEGLCEKHLENRALGYETVLLSGSERKEDSAKILSIFERLLSRMRNAEEVILYLQELGNSTPYRQEIQCIVASEPIYVAGYLVSPVSERKSRRENTSTDYHYLLKRYPLYNQQGQFMAHALQMHDITERVRDEKNRSALLSAVSHDLRTPLTTIKAAVSGLLQEGVPWTEIDQREILQEIEGETDHLTVLVNALVEMSRIEMGALHLEKEWCDLIEVFYGAEAKLQRVLGPCTILFASEEQIPLVYADHVQLEQAFFYLLEYILRHGVKQRACEVCLEVIKEEEVGAGMVRIVVTDQNRDLTAEERERIFSTYTTENYGPNGLGLAICKGIIEAHGGTITVESVAEGGVSFVFTLPAHPVGLVRKEENQERTHLEISYPGKTRAMEEPRAGGKQ